MIVLILMNITPGQQNTNYNSIIWHKCIHPCNWHFNQDTKDSKSPQGFLIPFPNHSPPHSQNQAYSSVPGRLTLPAFPLNIGTILQVANFCDWLTCHSMFIFKDLLSMFLYLSVCSDASTMRMYHSLSFHSSVNGYLFVGGRFFTT